MTQGTATPASEPVSVRVYRRAVRATLERIWENVLDWEHLPWLHRSSFRAIELLDADRRGWRARVEFAEGLGGGTAEIEVVVARDDLFYTTRTLSGVGAGTEIVTTLEAVADSTTGIAVDFRVPGVPPDQRELVGDAMQTLYATLWDEDEAMMVERQAVLDAGRAARDTASERSAAGRVRGDRIVLGRLAQLRGCFPLTITAAGQRYRLVELDGSVVVFSARCPHRGGRLDAGEARDGVVECPWHGYRFDICSGRSCDGRGLRLAPAPVVRNDPVTDELVLEWPGRDISR